MGRRAPFKHGITSNMSILIGIVEWVYSNVRIPKDGLVKMLEDLDADDDGYISVGEIVRAIKAWIGE